MTLILLVLGLILLVRGSAGGKLAGVLSLALSGTWWLWLQTDRRDVPSPPSPLAPTIAEASTLCPLCKRTAHYNVKERGQFLCSCRTVTDLWEEAPDGSLHRPPWFLRGYSPPDTEEWIERDPFQALLQIWFLVGTRVRYERDSKMYRGRDDVWQLASTTWDMRSGDCEDKSILLADWLSARRHEVRVVLGEAEGEGHAWVLLTEHGQDYILEATREKVNRRVPPLASVLGAGYLPRQQFDRRTVWTRRKATPTTDYHDPSDWLPLILN